MTPDSFTIEERMVDVGDGHQLYVQLWGNKDADNAIIFLHGGPGSGCNDTHKTLFDPAQHKVIFFDQRGCGRSLPYGSLEANDTDRQVEDIRTITDAFDIRSYTLTGGSWGSCLALAHAIKYPRRVNRMVLRGIFTGRQKEIDFLDKGEFRAFFPDVWQQFADSVPQKYRERPGEYHLPRVLGDDPEAQKRSAFAYALLEGSVMRLDDRVSATDYDTFDPMPSVVECQYLANACFLPEDYIMKNAPKLTMPVDLVQGRYDAVCPPFTAYELSQKLPNVRLFWTMAGHSGGDRANWETTKALLAR